MKNMQHNVGVSLIAIIFILVGVVGCGNNSDSAVREKKDKIIITDSSGANIQIPPNITRIADAWPAHNEVLTILGAGDKIVATVLNEEGRPWLYKVNSHMHHAVTAFSTNDVNIEEIMKAKPQIVFVPLSNGNVKKIADTGIPVVQLNFTDFTSLKECFRLTGTILGGEAKERAEAYIAYLDEKLNLIRGVTENIPKENRPKVLHLTTLSPLMVDGKNTIIDSWIDVAGGVNAASDINGNSKAVSMEQILLWNPDVIIVSSNTLNNAKDGIRNVDEILNNQIWQQVKAVQNGKVYVNPDGAFLWDRYGAEEALQIQWVAKLLNPDQFHNIDMVKETRYFYKTFMNYDLSEDEANRIIAGQPPLK